VELGKECRHFPGDYKLLWNAGRHVGFEVSYSATLDLRNGMLKYRKKRRNDKLSK
jgi:hypothetical protein